MAYNRKIMARARGRLADIRDANKEEHNRRLEEVYQRVPEIKEIDLQLAVQMAQLAKLVICGSPAPETVEKLKSDNMDLQMRRAELLTAKGYKSGWLDEIYTCKKCNDSGSFEGGICSCLERIYNEELTGELSSLLKTGNESFDTFNLSLYPAENREHMDTVKELCREFTEYFPNVENLLLSGAPGLGKTFLSACIARELSKKGYSIVYDTAISCLGAFEKQQFSKDAEQEAAASAVESMLSCDLMILDDLGTEFATPSAVSALYNLINTRINNNRVTVINTNLSLKEMEKRYNAAICSRIEGCYTILGFEGEDIRKKLKENR